MTIASTLARAAVLAAGLAAAGVASALGQSLGPSPQELNPAERVPAEGLDTRRADILAPPAPGACPLRMSAVRFTLREVTFSGAETVPSGNLQPAYADLIGREVPVSALCDIRDRALQLLFNMGLLARVEIPEQRITEGQVTFDVIEAYLASVRVTGDFNPGQSKVEDYIEMLRGMRPFNLRQAQRYLLLASDVPGVRIAASLRPSGAGRGAVDLEVNVMQERYGVIANVQNYGSHEVGPFGALLRGDLNNLTALGERTSLILYSTFDGREQRVIQATEEMRFGSEGLLGRLSLAYGDMRPGGVLSPLRIKGTSFVGSVGVTYPLIRSRRLNIFITPGVDVVDQKIDSSGTNISSDGLRVVNLSLSADRSWLTAMPVNVSGAIALRKGVTALGASHKGDANLSRLEADPAAFVLRGDGRATVQFAPLLSGSLRVAGQYADEPLLAYEEMPVGNLTIGRGYDPSALTGDRGIGASLQLDVGAFTLPVPNGSGGAVGLFGFGDIVMVDNLDTNGLKRSVRSIGIGVMWLLADRLRLDLTYAHPLDKVSDFAAKRPADRVLLNLIVRS